MAERETTTRAYTLKLQCLNDENKKRLWLTHEVINKGAKVFGEWLLTLRGGLSHELADRYSDGKKTTDAERKNRRIMLALSWLSVESKLGAPAKAIVSSGEESDSRRSHSVVNALKNILIDCSLKEKDIESWIDDCEPSITASIRQDAVWVNRRAIFKEKAESFSQEDIWDFLEYFFNGQESYLAPEKSDNEIGEENEENTKKEEKVKDLVQKAGHWLSKRFGEGKGTNFKSFIEVYQIIARWAEESTRYTSIESAVPVLVKKLKGMGLKTEDLNGINGLLSGPGYRSGTKILIAELNEKKKIEKDDWLKLKNKALVDVEKCKLNDNKGKGRRKYSDIIMCDVEKECGLTYLAKDDRARHQEFCVMLDHAARHVTLAHTWIKKAEAERRKFEEDSLCKAKINSKVIEWLDNYCKERAIESGSDEPVRIRTRAIDGWDEVISEWKKKDCDSETKRINAAKQLQSEIEKFGDIRLFTDLANENAKHVWWDGKEVDGAALKLYVKFSEANAKKRRFKVPAYRHPEMFLHPVFCDFGYSRFGIEYMIHSNVKKIDKNLLREIKLDLFDGNNIVETKFKWQSKRFMSDIASTFLNEGKEIREISRADRYGLAVAGVNERSKARAAGVFEAKNWNGRLQASRRELEKIYIAKMKGTNNVKIENMMRNVNWLISFSAPVEKKGPWYELEDANKGTKLNIDYGFNEPFNKNRVSMSRVVLSRIPGLRLLSIDLGHRYAAACAVWEAVTAETVNTVCKKTGIYYPHKDDDKVYVIVQEKGENGKDKRTVYRRVGPDIFGNKEKHPAPWARLDRQFLIKLQGEGNDVRMADNQSEMEAVKNIGKELGYKDTDTLPWNVDELMSETCYILKLALRRQGILAKAIYNLRTDFVIRPGNIKEKADQAGKLRNISSAVEKLLELIENPKWESDTIRKIYTDKLEKIGAPAAVINSEKNYLRRKKNLGREENIRMAAEKIATANIDEIINKFEKIWHEEDEKIRKYIKWVSSWIFPRSAKQGAAWHVGGLSLDRIATMKRVYQLKKAYKTRPEPADILKNIPRENDHSLDKFAQKTLDKMEKLREQRVKQLASRITEAALGIGIEKAHEDSRTVKRPVERIKSPRFASCHAVVIENLENYRPEETRTRRENRQLMVWSSSKVAKFVKESCELNGLHLCYVQASYTSRQDSRTGAPGIRCSDKPVKDFLRKMSGKIAVINENVGADGKGGTEEDRYLKEMFANWNEEEKIWKDNTGCTWKLESEKWILKSGKSKSLVPNPVRMPQRGGEIFVSADKDSPLKNGIQADLNAAANIGLKALLDPDWNGKWWYVPCNSKDYVPINGRVKGSKVFDAKKQALKKTVIGEKSEKKEKKNIKNLWKDISGGSVYTGTWMEYAPYWNDVTARVIKNLRG